MRKIALALIFCFVCACAFREITLAQGTGYPLNTEMTGSFGSGGGGKDDERVIDLTCKVVKDGDTYLYTYKIKNRSKKSSIMCGWKLLDVVSGGPRGWGIPNWWDIGPEKEIVMTLKSKEAPIEYFAPAYIMEKARGDDKAWGEMFSGHGVTMPAGEFSYVNSAGQPGPVPPSFVKKKKE